VSEALRFKDGFFTVEDGLRLHYRDYPGDMSRLPLLCLHGLTRNSKDFAEFAERHSPNRRVIALDVRGRGLSEYDPQPERYTPLVYSGDVIRLMDHLGFAEAIFVGTSLGGLVTMTVAAFEPDRIAAAILNDVGPELADVGIERIKNYVGRGSKFDTWEEAAESIADYNERQPASYGTDDWVKMAKRLCREEKGQIVFDYDQSIALPFNTKGAAPNVDLWPLFGTLAEKPLLIVRGALSDLLTAETLARMAAVSSNVAAVTVPGVAHAPMLDEPVAANAIDAFLARLD
jgi:pimeloyl-ACP methyl ester carboxylesterase